MSDVLEFRKNPKVVEILNHPQVKGTNSLRAFFDKIRAVAKDIDPELAKLLITKGDDGFAVHASLIEEEPGYNPRDYSRPEVVESIDYLSKRYLNGMHVDPPSVVVRNGVVFVREGHTRRHGWRKAIGYGADIERIAVVKFSGSLLDEAMVPVTSNSGNRLAPLELAEIICRARDNFNKSIEEIASAVSMSGGHVRNHLKLLELPDDMLGLVRNGMIRPDLALSLHREHGSEAYNVATAKMPDQSGEPEEPGTADDDPSAPTAKDAPKKERQPVRITPKMLASGTPAVLNFNKKRKEAVWSTVSGLASKVEDRLNDIPDDAEVSVALSKSMLVELVALRDELQSQIERSKPAEEVPAREEIPEHQH